MVSDAQDHASRITDHAAAWFRLGDAARVWGCSKPTAQARVRDAGWPTRTAGNRLEFAPPPDIAEPLIAALGIVAPPDIRQDNIEFATAPARSRELALMRQKVVLHVERLLSHGRSFEKAAQAAVIHFAKADEPHLFSTASVRRWLPAYRQHGLNGLVDRKAGVVGVKRASQHLSPDEIIRGQAMALEYGSVAKAARVLGASPRLGADAREYLHGAHSSKSYVTPSIREALRVSPLTKALAQGPRKARLEGRYTVGDYSHVKAGDVFCSDDMTSNVLCWVEWPNAQGWRIVQPQILPVLDVGSLRWLNVRVIARDGGQYTADDIWGLFGDVFDTFGLPTIGFLLEGGHWQSNKVRGAKTGLDAEERIGGLEGLGLKMIRSYDPRSKHIEGQFHHFQTEVDRVTGYAGRDQRKQLPEAVKKQRALCEGGHRHPREFFLHLSQYATHCQQVMENMNHERREGQILRGESALEKWANDNPQLPGIPEAARWLYRSARNIVQVTRNGLRITQGSGAKQLVYYYDNPAILAARQGTRVIVFWNDANPDADAIIIDHATRKFLCSAPRVKPLNRFAATDAELAAEAKRKQSALHYARTELRAMQPELARRQRPAAYDGEAAHLGDEIRAATERAAERDRSRAQTRRAIASASVDADDVLAALSGDHESRLTDHETFTADEIHALLTDDDEPTDETFPARSGRVGETASLTDPDSDRSAPDF